MLNRSDIKTTERDKTLLSLLANESLPNKAIAEQLGISERNVKARLFRLYCRAGLQPGDGNQRVRLAAIFRSVREKQIVRVPLTDKEWIISRLVAEGLRNASIASRLGTTEKMVGNYLRSIFDKTGVWSRLELAAWVEAHGQ